MHLFFLIPDAAPPPLRIETPSRVGRLDSWHLPGARPFCLIIFMVAMHAPAPDWISLFVLNSSSGGWWCLDNALHEANVDLVHTGKSRRVRI